MALPTATLGDLPAGASAVVTAVSGDGPLRRRLMEMGLLPGTAVAVIRLGPLGDPVELELRDYRLSIRSTEAGRVEVDQVEGVR